MYRFSALTLTLVLIALASAGFAQDCTNFHKRKCDGSENALMAYNTQSKSAMFVLGHTSELVFVAHSGQDYRVSLCYDDKIEEPLKFKILDGRNKEVLFDNEAASLDAPNPDSPGGLPQHFEFSCDVTKKIIVRITAPGPPPEEGGKGKNSEPDPESLFCVGVLVENMPTPALGF